MAAWETIDRALAALGIRFGAPTSGQTTGGSGHVPGSEHYVGRARDYGTSDSDADSIARALLPYATGPDYVVDELFYSPLNIFFDKGQAITATAKLRQGHYSHVHVGLAPGADLAAAVERGGGSSSFVPEPAGSVTGDGTGGGGGVWGGVADFARRAAATIAFTGAGVVLVVLGARRSAGTRGAS